MTESWISLPVPSPSADVRLVCFPHAGGGASAFVPWARALAPEGIEVLALKLPGREARVREAPIDDLPTLVALIDDVVPEDGSPIVWWGHSSGARVAFEVARRRRARGGILPARLIVSGAPAPDVRRSTPTLHRIEGDQPFLEAVAQAYGGVPETVLGHHELRSLVAPALRADLRLHERYVFTEAAPLPIPIVALGGDRDPSVSPAWLDGWRRHTSADFQAAQLPGAHFFVYDTNARSVVLRALVDAIRPATQVRT